MRLDRELCNPRCQQLGEICGRLIVADFAGPHVPPQRGCRFGEPHNGRDQLLVAKCHGRFASGFIEDLFQRYRSIDDNSHR